MKIDGLNVTELLNSYISRHNLNSAFFSGVLVKELNTTYGTVTVKDNTLWQVREKVSFMLPPAYSAAVKTAEITLSVHVRAKEQAWQVQECILEALQNKISIIKSDYVEHGFRGALMDCKMAESVIGKKYKVTIQLMGQEVGDKINHYLSYGNYTEANPGIITIENPGTYYSPARTNLYIADGAVITGLLRHPATYEENQIHHVYASSIMNIILDGVTGAVIHTVNKQLSTSYPRKTDYDAYIESFDEEAYFENAWSQAFDSFLMDANGLPIFAPGETEVKLVGRGQISLSYYPVYI